MQIFANRYIKQSSLANSFGGTTVSSGRQGVIWGRNPFGGIQMDPKPPKTKNVVITKFNKFMEL